MKPANIARRSGLKRVLIIHTDGNLFNNPSLKCIVDLLLENGCQIDFRYPRTPAPMPARQGIRLLPFGRIVGRLKGIIFNYLCAWPLVYLSVLLESVLLYRRYDLIIGVDRQGLIEANVINRLRRTPFLFVSFEIMFESETSVRYKLLEKQASKRVTRWLVQDHVRAEQLQRENSLSASNRVFLPLASAGVGASSSERLRDQLGVPVHRKVAIAIGSVASWSMTAQILSTLPDWPDEWALIVHERYGQTRQLLAKDLVGLQGLLGKKLFISEAATAMVDDLGTILAGVDVGLAFYEPDFKTPYTGKNLQYLGLAAGKISTYFRYRVPVIVNEIGLYADNVREFDLGCVVERPEQIPERLEAASREQCRHNAADYFSKKLDFNSFRDEIWYRFLALGDSDSVR